MTQENAKIKVTVDKDLEELIPEFLDLTRKDLANLNDALAKNEIDTVRRIGHTLKGNGGGYGFDKISELGAKIEQLAKAGSPAEVPALLQELTSYLDRVEVVFE
jgi:histidine phosphotransfer protein HptB